MKIKTIFASMLAALALTACSTSNDAPPPGDTDFETAYLTLRITPPTKAKNRASTEEEATQAESAINTLYVLTFDASKQVVKHVSQTSAVYIMNTGFTTAPGTGVTSPDEPILISPNTKYLLVVANPGEQMRARLTSLAVGSTYAEFNRMITVPAPASGNFNDLANEIRASNNTNFTMINAGGLFDGNATGDARNEDCLLDVTSNVKASTDYATAPDPNQAASDAAAGEPAELRLERLAAKVVLTVDSGIAVSGSPSSLPTANVGQFRFEGWDFDNRNSQFFPYARKTEILAGHTAGDYTDNFYTVDPNFVAANFTSGLYKNTVDANRAPIVSWNPVTTPRYCIENTMAADDQYYEAATRLIIKGTYSPMTQWTLGDDWFSFGTMIFQNLAAVQTRYEAAQDTGAEPYPAFVQACLNFMGAVNKAGNFSLTDFMDMEQATHLDVITDGGQITNIPDCIRWYDEGVNYYTYEIRHDNTNNVNMYYGKYGVVRNNWYQLKLTSVSGGGTPWIPDPGPGPIDPGNAYLSFEISVNEWIYWTNNIGI